MGRKNKPDQRRLFRKGSIYDGIKPYTVNLAENSESAEINLYGGVVETRPTDWWTGEKIDGLFIALDEFLEDMDRLNGMRQIRFNINSTGGEVNAGVAIYNKIRQLSQNGATVTTRVEGAADSAAALIAQAGDIREVAVGSEVMVHCASCLLFGFYDSKSLDGAKAMLDETDRRIAELLSDSTGRPVQEMKRMMQRTSWMTADQAEEEGFADLVVNQRVKVERVEDAQNTLIFNGIPHAFRGIPMPGAYALTAGSAPLTEGSANRQTNMAEPAEMPFCIDSDNITKGGTKMTRQELEAQYPEIVNEIRAEAANEAKSSLDSAVDSAVKAERDRIRGIEEIENTISDKTLVYAAKYEKLTDAAALALDALKAQTKAAAARDEARDKELQASGVYGVEPDPIGGSEAENRRRDVADGAALIAGINQEVK